MPVITVEGRQLKLTNLEKVIYPDRGTTKGEVLHYYATHGGSLLPHLTGRPLSFLRYPSGPDGSTFFTKNVPPGTPEWVKTGEVPRSDGTSAPQVLLENMSDLVWAANLVAELHTPQWRVGRPGQADRLVFDLDPGAPADIVACCHVAQWLRERLHADGLHAGVKTSGSKGLHLLCPLDPPASSEAATAYAKALAVAAADELSGLATATMARRQRAGKVFIDFSQNAAAKTTAAPYTLRARSTPSISTPISWAEVAECEEAGQLAFGIDDIGPRLAEHGDLLDVLLDPDRAGPLPEAR